MLYNRFMTLEDMRGMNIEDIIRLYKDGYRLSPITSNNIESLQEQQPFINTVFGIFLISFMASLIASYVIYKEYEEKKK